MKKLVVGNERGVALITALLVSVAIMAIAIGVIYFIIQSTTMSGAGKRYATAAEAADGAIELVKDSINMSLWGETLPTSVVNTYGGSTNCQSGGAANLNDAIRNQGRLCVRTFNLPGVGSTYTVTITVTQLFSSAIAGGRLEFSRLAGGAPSTAIYYRITADVTGSNNTRAENAALYRFAG